MKKFNLKVGIDCDDVLYSCNDYALKLLNAEKKYDPPLDVNDIKVWGKNSKELDERVKFFGKESFVATQPPLPGAKDFVKKLSKRVEIFIPTAVPAECATARAMKIIKDFPWVPTQNIILSERKDVLNLDIVLDDGSHNILKSAATYPVLMRRPWNTNLSGGLAVNNYDDFIHLIDMICQSYADKPSLKDGGVICLIGPSGSGKTAIMEELVKEDGFLKPLTTTSRPKRSSEDNNAYNFVNEKQFLDSIANDEFLETTVYSGYHYGTSKEKIDEIIKAKKIAIMPIDICGGIAIKNAYRGNSLLVFINRNKEDVILNIVGRNVSDKDKTNRIISLEREYKNLELCDEIINNTLTIKEAAKQLKEIVKKNI